MMACIDGGIFCVGIPLLLAAAFPWLARKIYKVCHRKCACDCHGTTSKASTGTSR